jgi:hypothetical protein
MKMNWGFGLGAVYILFIAGILIMVFIFMNQDVGLEAKDYYEKGIKYQERIDQINRTKELHEQIDVSTDKEYIRITFPKIFRTSEIIGKIYFYRPANDKKDFVINIKPDTASIQNIPINKFDKGMWKIKIDWSAKNNNYYNEKILMIN